MATYKWIGDNGGADDPNDIAAVANWQVEQGGSFIPASTIPGSGDTMLVPSGTITDSTTNFSANTILFTGGLETLNVAGITFDAATTLSTSPAASATLATNTGVVLAGTATAAAASSTLAIALGDTLLLSGAIAASGGGRVIVSHSSGAVLQNEGTVAAVGGSLLLQAADTGNGVLEIGSGTLDITSTVAGDATILFVDAAGTLVVGPSATVEAAILGFAPGDAIDLQGVSFASVGTVTVNGDIATLTDGTHSAGLDFFGAGFASGSFALNGDGSGGTLLTLAPTAEAVYAAGTSGDWSGIAWNTSPPGRAEPALITSQGTSFAVTLAGTATAAGSLTMLAPAGTLDVGQAGTSGPATTLAIADGLLDEQGSVAVNARATLTVGGLVALGPLGTLAVDGGSLATTGIIAPGTFADGTEENSGTLLFDGGALTDSGVALVNTLASTGGAVLSIGTELSAVQADLTGATILTVPTLVTTGLALLDTAAVLDVTNATVGDATLGATSLLQVSQVLLANSLTLDQSSGVSVGSGVATNGTLLLTGGGSSEIGTLATDGMVSLDSASALVVGVGAPEAGTFVVAAGADASFAGAMVPTLEVDGTATISGSLAATAITGAGTIVTAGMEIGTAATYAPTILLGTGNDSVVTLTLDHAAAFTGTVDVPTFGFSPTERNATAVFDLRDVPLATAQSVFTGAISSLGTLAPFSVVPVPSQPDKEAWSIGSDGSGGTNLTLDVSAVCYVAGTAIATPAGERKVESLRPGDLVLAARRGRRTARAVRWVGQMVLDLDRHPQPALAAPIRIRAGAVADGVPSRDLLVSPDHAVFAHGALVPARVLLNGATVVRAPARGVVRYHHVELDAHALLLAEGMRAESYLDTGNRGWFAGEAGVRPLHPDLAAGTGWRRDACAPLTLSGPKLEAARAAMLARAEAFGYLRTADPGLSVLADGAVVPLAQVAPLVWRARLPAGVCAVRLLSASFVPSEADPASADHRRLGIAVSALRVGGRVPAGAYAAGWHAPEAKWRWSDGDGQLALRPRGEATVLEIRAAAAAAFYWCPPDATGAPPLGLRAD